VTPRHSALNAWRAVRRIDTVRRPPAARVAGAEEVTKPLPVVVAGFRSFTVSCLDATNSTDRRSNDMKKLLNLALLLLALSHALVAAPVSKPAKIMSATEIGLALEKLNVLGTALYLAAHPDDENTAMISWLSKEQNLQTGYLSLTRGDGGQNLIGDEQNSALGVIRTQELIAARSIDGGRQFFSRAIDFGYTKRHEEALDVWGHDAILADTVWVIRRFRPDVVITRFPTTGEGGHGHHTASAIFASEAFEAAADPSRFPEQLATVGTWQVRRLFWDDFRPFFGRGDRNPDLSKHLKVDIGAYNARLGRSYTEIAGEARTMHKSQGFGAAERRGSFLNYLSLTRGDEAKVDPFEGIDMTWGRVTGGERVASLVDEAIHAYDPSNPAAIIPRLTTILDALDSVDDAHWASIKRGEVLEIIRSAAGLWLEAIADDVSATPGGAAKIRLTAINRSDVPVTFVAARSAWTGRSTADRALASNKPEQLDLEVAVPRDAGITQPYWLMNAHPGGRYELEDLTLVGDPENAPALVFTFELLVAGHPVAFDVPVLHRRVDPVKGEVYRAFAVEPPVTVGFEQSFYLFPDGSARELRVRVRAGAAGTAATIGLDAPAGWTVDPATREVLLAHKGDEVLVTFRLTPAGAVGFSSISAWARLGERRHSWSRASIEYDHIPTQVWYAPATSRLVREDLARNGSTIGYVAGSGDEIPGVLRQAGFAVEMLDESALAGDDLSAFDAIVLGVRVLNTRRDAVLHYDRLLDYVRHGGTLVVQYNTTGRELPERIGPWPMKISRDRITEEDATMTFAVGRDHPLLSSPNRIEPADFDGWVQERGLYFAGEWDERYEPILEGSDTGEEPVRGALLYTRHGEGVFIYTGLSFFRQLPAGVPGAFKLFVNLVSAK
jgi:LmbE family N-acetylglucosaminyl deacetylase